MVVRTWRFDCFSSFTTMDPPSIGLLLPPPLHKIHQKTHHRPRQVLHHHNRLHLLHLRLNQYPHHLDTLRHQYLLLQSDRRQDLRLLPASGKQ